MRQIIHSGILPRNHLPLAAIEVGSERDSNLCDINQYRTPTAPRRSFFRDGPSLRDFIISTAVYRRDQVLKRDFP